MAARRTTRRTSRLMHGLAGAATVVGIVAASLIGLNDWADDAAVHIGPQHDVSSHGASEI